MLYCKEIINHRIGDNTPFQNVANSLGWTIILDEFNIEKAYDGSLWEKGFAPSKPQSLINQERVTELKQLLADSDYQAIKFAEGWLSEAEYTPIKEQREAYREEIRSLENAE